MEIYASLKNYFIYIKSTNKMFLLQKQYSLRKIKPYLLSKCCISKVKTLEIRITFIIGTPQMFTDISFKILMKNINLNNN